MKKFKCIFLLTMSLLCLNHVHSQGWIDVSVDTNYAFNSIEYIHEIDEFFVGGIGGVYRWDYQDWEWQQVYGAQDNSVYNNGLLGINKTVLICYSLLDENFENCITMNQAIGYLT